MTEVPMSEHPITPPPELVQQWASNQDYSIAPAWMLNDLATRAAQWGADQELKACCEWMVNVPDFYTGSEIDLRAARRPKPPSLKEQALALIDGCTNPEGDYLDDNVLSTIRRALEALPE
jgi:hypothetical protein